MQVIIKFVNRETRTMICGTMAHGRVCVYEREYRSLHCCCSWISHRCTLTVNYNYMSRAPAAAAAELDSGTHNADVMSHDQCGHK